MGNGKNAPFDRRDYARSNIAGFLQSETKGINLVTGRLNALNKQPLQNSSENAQKRQILEKCLALFRSPKFKESVKKEKAERGILEQDEVTRETRLDNLEKISKYSENLTDRLSEIVLGDLKRKYNMADKCTDGMVTEFAPVKYTPLPPLLDTTDPSKKDWTIRKVTDIDSFGNIFTIEELGSLYYKAQKSEKTSTVTLKEYSVTKCNNTTSKTFKIFSNINFNDFIDNPEYAECVMTGLLSDNNVELSNANGYVGELQNISESKRLQLGEELDDSGHYMCRISDNYSLDYLGDRIEALRKYERQQEMKKTIKQASQDDAR